MTDDLSPPKDIDSSTRAPHAVQRLDGPEALLTAEWTIPDLPWITAADDTADGAPQGGERVMPPPPPSRCEPATAFTAAASATQNPTGGSHSFADEILDPQAFENVSRNPGARPLTAAQVALLGATGTAAPLITRPKPQRLEVQISPSVVIASDLGATLPPRAEREAPASPSEELSAPSLKTRRTFVALGTAVGFVLGYGLWTAVVHSAAASVAPERRLPQFLRESSPPAVAPSVTGPAASPPSLSALPPSFAATLARALPPATSEAAPLAGDAGAAAALLEDTPGPSEEPVSAETRRRAEVLRAALEAQRLEPAAEVPTSKTRTQMPSAARRTPKSRPPLAIPSPSATGRARKSPSAESLDEDTEARTPRAQVSAALRPLTTYTYEDKALFAIATAPLRVTDLTLEPGETLVSQPTAGDAARWVISVVQGGDRSHVFVKPLRPGLRTNLTLTTSRRSYFLELSCRDDGTYMAGVVWQYPADERARRREALAQAEHDRQSTTAVSDLQALRFDYRIEGTPSWTPTMVFDDGKKTFIRFPRPVSPDQAPALFLLRSGSARDATYVNYRVKGDLYVVDRLVEAAELRLGNDDDDQEVVRITRKH